MTIPRQSITQIILKLPDMIPMGHRMEAVFRLLGTQQVSLTLTRPFDQIWSHMFNKIFKMALKDWIWVKIAWVMELFRSELWEIWN